MTAREIITDQDAIADEPTASNATRAYESTVSNSDDSHKKRLLWILLALLVLLGLIAFLVSANKSDSDSTAAPKTSSSSSNSQATSSLATKFQQSVAESDRTFFFNPDVTDEQDATQVDSGIAKIVAFYKANDGTKLTVNGSVFDGQAGDNGEPLAQQRAQLIQQKLVAGGVKSTDLQTTAVNAYTGQTDAAKAEYARSVTVTAH